MTGRRRLPARPAPSCTSRSILLSILLAGSLLPSPLTALPEAPDATVGSAAAPAPGSVGMEATTRAEIESWIARLGRTYEDSTAATRALEEIGPPAVPVLVAALPTADDSLRWDLVNVLGALGSAEALEPLVRTAVLHGEVHARWRAYWAVAAVDDGRARGLLTPYLEHADAEVRWRAAVALAFLEDAVAVPHLEAGLDAAEEWKRWEAVNSLASVHREGSWQKVAELATGDPEAPVRQEAVMTLWKLGEPRAREVLQAAAEDPSPQVRWRALAALAEVAPELEAWARRRAAEDPAPEVQETFER